MSESNKGLSVGCELSKEIMGGYKGCEPMKKEPTLIPKKGEGRSARRGADKNKKKAKQNFNREAGKVKRQLMDIAKKYGISSMSHLAIDGDFSGGMIGDAGAVIEALFFSAKRDKHIRQMLELTVEALKSQDEIDERERLAGLQVSTLFDAGRLSNKLFNTLSELEIITLDDVTVFTQKEFSVKKGIGKKAMEEIAVLMKENKLEFKKEAQPLKKV